MGLILTRSPFHVSREGLDANALLTVEVRRLIYGNFYILDSYNLDFRSNYFIDISNLCSIAFEPTINFNPTTGSYQDSNTNNLKRYETGNVRTVITGSINGTVQPDIEREYWCTEGYAYASENPSKDYVSELRSNSYYAGSSDIIYKLDDANLRIPILHPEDNSSTEYVYVSFLSKGKVVAEDTVGFAANGGTEGVSKFSRTFDYDSFLNRINSEQGTIELSKCIDDFFEEHRIDDVDEVYISSGGKVKVLKVKTVEECKYNPYRITFKNRYGVAEDLWFFKKSVESISVKSDVFRANQFKARNSTSGITTTRSIRSNQEYNKNGKISITLNSGFVDEALNESFKQLMLSEEVELYDFNNDVLSAVTIKDSELKLKTSTNDKLINYTIEVEMSNNIIDDIV